MHANKQHHRYPSEYSFFFDAGRRLAQRGRIQIDLKTGTLRCVMRDRLGRERKTKESHDPRSRTYRECGAPPWPRPRAYLANIRPKGFVKVEGLPGDYSASDVINLFYKYDRRLRIVDIRRSGERAVAVVEFSNVSAMHYAIDGRNGYEIDEVPLKVFEIATPPKTKGGENKAEYDEALAAAHDARSTRESVMPQTKSK